MALGSIDSVGSADTVDTGRSTINANFTELDTRTDIDSMSATTSMDQDNDHYVIWDDNVGNLTNVVPTDAMCGHVPTYTVASAPAAATAGASAIAYISNGAAGSPVLAFSDGTNWLRSDTLAAIAAS